MRAHQYRYRERGLPVEPAGGLCLTGSPELGDGWKPNWGLSLMAVVLAYQKTKPTEKRDEEAKFPLDRDAALKQMT